MMSAVGLLRRVLGGVQIVFLMAAVVMALPVTVFIVIFVINLIVSPDHVLVDRTVYPSPDRMVSAIEEIRLGGGAAGWRTDDTYLVGSMFSESTQVGDGLFSFEGWVDDHTLAVCDPSSAPLSSVEVVGEDGQRRTYRVVVDCPTQMQSHVDAER